MTPFEIATGAVLGMVPPTEAGAGPPHTESPRAGIERLLLDALQQSPCVVAFSGGRDSSAVLALAVHVARRHGLPMPVPVTRRFPGHPDADETEWQTLVIRHLGIREWVRLPLQGQCDVIGPIASSVLRRHGVLWPPVTFINVPLFEVARGGAVVTGEGGDEVFGRHRATPILHLLRGNRRRRRAAIRELPLAIAPTALRTTYLRHRFAEVDTRAWLLPPVRQRFIDLAVRDLVAEPLAWKRATVDLVRSRAWVVGAATRQRLADEYDVRVDHPFLDPEFLTAFAHSGHVLGPMTRAAAMRGLFGDVLPHKVLRRTSKARFNAALLSETTREFAAAWSGGGVDTTLVDEDLLRAEWLRPLPHACSIALLQTAWMATQGWPLSGPCRA